MNNKPLIETNPYLKNEGAYEKSLFVNVSSSATIELGKLSVSIIEALASKKPLTVIYVSPDIEKVFSQ